MANDFSGDSNCKALWRFESGALTTDSKGSNTLTDNNTVGTDTVNYKEGAASADLEKNQTEYFSITDANLDSGFPLKSGESNGTISVCFWIKPESFESVYRYLFVKWFSPSERSIIIAVTDTDKMAFAIGVDNGTASESIIYDTALSASIFYHVAITFDNSDYSYRIRIWDDNAGDFLDSDKTGNFTKPISIENSTLAIGALSVGTVPWDGLIDEMVVFDDVLSTAEIDQIRAGTYSGASERRIFIS